MPLASVATMQHSALRSFTNKLRTAFQRLRRALQRIDSVSPQLHRTQLFPPLGTLSARQREWLEQVLAFSIRHIAYYEQALLHRSALPQLHIPEACSNERLEFLGDALLGFLTAEYLFLHHPELPEGELTKRRTWLVNRQTLAVCARHLQLERLLTLSSSARRTLQQGNTAVLADALEALLAAVYLDQGLEAARRLVRERLLPIAEQEQLLHDTNYKSLLLEYAQAHGEGTPQYRVLEERGPDHAKEFVVGVYIGEYCWGIGVGRSKKEAEQHAARKALQMVESPSQEKVHGTAHL